MTTSIEWTRNADGTEGESWNPIRARRKSDGKRGWFCQRISPGCTHCYAAAMNRWRGNGVDYAVPALDEVELYLDEDALLQPLRWKKPRSIFVCSMTDLFADFVPDEWIEQIYAVMALAYQHTFMVLTKRPERRQCWYRQIETGSGANEGWRSAMVEGQAQSIYTKLHPDEDPDHIGMWLAVQLPLPNVREGTSICTQGEAEDLIPVTLKTPAALHWLSMEPLLERVEISGWLMPSFHVNTRGCTKPLDMKTGELLMKMGRAAYKQHGGALIDWVVVGGESGRGARRCDEEWIHSIVQQCRAAGTPCFVKQLGSHHPAPGDSKGGDWLWWPEYLRVREMPAEVAR